MQPKSSLTIAIGGSSSSGKTSSVALLSQLLPASKTVFVIADAFSKEFKDLPVSASGFLDADSRNSIWYDKVKATVQHAQIHGSLPEYYPQHDFIANDLARAKSSLSHDFVGEMEQLIGNAKIDWDRWQNIIILDGILLYHDEGLMSMIDIKLLLRTSKKQAKQRRVNRYGGVWAPEGAQEFWKTEQYFEECVWPNYSSEHAWLFEEGDVEAANTSKEAASSKILIPPEPDMSVEDTLAWEVETLINTLVGWVDTELER